MDEKYRKENPGEREEKKTERKRGEKLILVVCQAEERQNLCVEIHYSQLQCEMVGLKHFLHSFLYSFLYYRIYN